VSNGSPSSKSWSADRWAVGSEWINPPITEKGSTMNKKLAPLVIVGVIAFVLGLLLRGGGSEVESPSPVAEGTAHDGGAGEGAGHAQMQDEGMNSIRLTPVAEKLAEIEVVAAERRPVDLVVRMVGKIDYDESRLGYITAYVAGRLDRLFVGFTGAPVRKGEHMVSLYSPDLLAAQEELLQAIRTVDRLEQSNVSVLRERVRATVETSRDKLRLWGLTAEQIADIEAGGEPREHVTIYSPMSGIVIHKNAQEGMYVDVGSRIYTIADLSSVWVKLDAYESDLTWLRYAQEVDFEVEAYPGEPFRGRISFIDPVLDRETRTVKVRVNVPNADGRLKPEMFVRAVVRPEVTADGRVTNSALEGKWVSRMHPEIIRSRPGTCDVCAGPLVSVDSLGYFFGSSPDLGPPLVIPASAPLSPGERAVVYVKVPGGQGLYEGREISLGPRTGDGYVVKSGLEEGELVVVNGNFRIDSALQIQARKSMMNPEGGGPAPAHGHGGESN
jgi:Cu(I)/Ag(I) efflux system membrane fusion protein